MSTTKRDRISVYVLAGAVCVAGLVAYLRFFRGAEGEEGERGEEAGPATVLNLQDVDRVAAEFRAGEQVAREPFGPVARDLFRPVEGAAEGGAAGAVADRDLRLEAVMVMDGEALASIGDKLYRTGDAIGPYTVTRITEDQVVLQAGERTRVLELWK